MSNHTQRQDDRDAMAPEPAQRAAAAVETPQVAEGRELVVDDLLVEDVSIDGMCGVY